MGRKKNLHRDEIRFSRATALRTRFIASCHLLPGDNVQGKTNILEATANRYLPLPARLCYI